MNTALSLKQKLFDRLKLARFKHGLFALCLILIIISPFGLQTANALPDFCDVWVVSGICNMVSSLLYIPMVIASWILWLSGVLLNFVLNHTVVEMSQNIRGITGINIAWGTIRDLANISFIFILLYAAIGTILNLEKVNWKQTVVKVVIAAILINFSLFFTKVIIDGSNIIALGFYNSIVPPSADVASGLSNQIMKPLGLTTFYNVTEGADLLDNFNNSFAKVATVSFGSSAFMVITAFVFAAAAIMFITRFVTFIFLLILSPLAFLGSALPKIGEYTSKWWKSLISQAVFAPAFMIMVWVTLTILNSGGFLCINPGGDLTSAREEFSSLLGGLDPESLGSGGCSGVGLVMNFVIINSFIIGSLIISKQISNQGGEGASKIVSGALGVGAGLAGWAGRRTVGSLGRKYADDEGLKDVASQKGAKGFLARTALRSSQVAAKGSFDARSSRFAGMGNTLGMGDLGIGGKAGGKGGYDSYIKEKVKKKEDFAKSFGSSDLEKDRIERELERAKADLNEHDERVRRGATPNLPERARLSVALGDAKKKSDEIKGISEEEARKRNRKTLKDLGNNTEEINRLMLSENEDNLERILGNRLVKKSDSLAAIRQKSYAKTVESGTTNIPLPVKVFGKKNISLPVSPNRVFGIGMMKRANLQAGASIRKMTKGKSAAEEVFEKIKKESEDSSSPPPAASAPSGGTPAP